ncbi:cytochrome P450 [Streptomyces sp. SID3343]|uniref:cytochrome P450 n=1 Tax=Streptomyces sp. SID3343 TaxID=2690260 RepID=UPI0031F97BF5
MSTPPAFAFPIPRTCPFAVPDEYAGLREEQPAARVVLPTGKTAWILTRYADVRAVLASPNISADIRHPNFPAMGAGEQEAGAKSRPFIRTDPPEHTRYRRMLLPELTVKRVRAMRPAVQEITDGVLDRMLDAGPGVGSGVDLVPAYANAVSTSTICELIGLPKDDLEFFHDITRISGGRASTAAEVSAALGALFQLLGELIALREREPGDDLLSKLVVDHLRTGNVTHRELLSTIGITVIAGRETTTNMISLSTLLLLLREPDRMAELRTQPELIPAAVDELLRVLSIADSIPLRVAGEDIDIAGTVIPAGDGVIALLGAADHDPDVFPDPATVDFHRGNRHHVAFGYGIHQCVGQHLARLELEIALETLIRRVPTLRLAVPFEDLTFKQESATFGVTSLPVSW